MEYQKVYKAEIKKINNKFKVNYGETPLNKYQNIKLPNLFSDNKDDALNLAREKF